MELLKKTVRSYFIFSVVMLLVAVPVFYFVLREIVITNIDEDLLATKTRIIPLLRSTIRQGYALEMPDHSISLERTAPQSQKDSISTIDELDTNSYQVVPKRLLTTHVLVNRDTYRLQVRISMANHNALIKSIIIVQALLLLTLLVGLLMINRNLSKKIWQPFYKTLQQLNTHKIDQDAPMVLEKSSIKEFNDLNEAIGRLTERSYHAYISQKEFTENASHELQTPLAVFQSKLELLMQSQALTEEQAGLITDMALAARRMARLNKNLLLLTRIENGQYPEREAVSFRELIGRLLGQYEYQLEQKSITLKTDLREDAVLQVNRAMAEMLVSNLLSNGIRHNTENGQLLVQLTSTALRVSNTGAPQSLAPDKLFKRFQKSSTDLNSLGLGLEIVQKISSMNNFTVDYRFEGNLHTFTIHF